MTPHTDLQKPEREFIHIGAGYRVQTRGGGSTFRILGPDRPYVIVTSEFDHPFYTTMARAIKAERNTLAARVIELEAELGQCRQDSGDWTYEIQRLKAENKRLREANYKAFTDGMEAAAQICGTLAEVEYDDADGFEAATGCEAAIMRVVKEQRTEQALNKEPTP